MDLRTKPYRTVVAGIVVLSAVAALAYLLNTALSARSPRFDAHYLWLAGAMWNAGLDPYGRDFFYNGVRLFEPGQQPVFWAYPPHWWPLLGPLGLMGVHNATIAWNVLGLFGVICGCELLRRTRLQLGRSASLIWTLILVTGLAFLSPIAIGLFFGQTSLIILAGMCLLTFGLARRSIPLVSVALVIAMLKPNIGLPVLVAVALSCRRDGPLAAAGAVAGAGLLALPALLITPLPKVLSSLAAVSQRYEGFLQNSPVEQTGLANLVLAVGGPTIPSSALFLSATLSAALLTLVGRRGVTDRWQAVQRLMFAALASTAFYNRLHLYDLALLLPLAILMDRLQHGAWALCVAGGIAIARPKIIVMALASLTDTYPSASTIASLGTLAIYVAAVIVCVSRPRAEPL